jgi:RNA polymerase sigma-70 factor (ECF subfamily)
MNLASVMTATLRVPGEEPIQGISDVRFEEVMRMHQRRVYRVLMLLVKDPDAADTLTQECFLRAYQHWASFRGECRVDTWLLKIAANLARDYSRNRRISFWKRLVGLDHPEQAEVQVPAAEASPEKALLAREELAAVWAATSQLSEQQRAVFLLRFAEDMPLAEIADVLGVRTGSVKAQLSRAGGKVRRLTREQHR